MLISVWRWFGFNLVILLAGLQGIAESYYEAAEVDGANGRQQFRLHYAAAAAPGAALCHRQRRHRGVAGIRPDLRAHPRGGPMFSTETMVVYIYRQGFTNFDMGVRQRRGAGALWD